MPLRHGLVAIYVRDTDPHSIGLRWLKRQRNLDPEQRRDYRQWLDAYRQWLDERAEATS
jgi:hypothetical protein